MPRAGSEVVRSAGHRRPPRGSSAPRSRTRIRLVVHFGEGETVECDLMLVSVGRARWSRASASGGRGRVRSPDGRGDGRAQADVRAAHLCRRRSPGTGSSRTAFREGEIAAENATGAGSDAGGGRSSADLRTPRSPASALGKPRPASRHGKQEHRRGPVPVGGERARRHVRRSGRMGEDDPRDDVRECIGVVIVGAHATDLIEAAVVALDAESTIETIADGMAAHPSG